MSGPHRKYLLGLLFYVLSNVVLTHPAYGQINLDSFYNTYQKFESDEQLASFVSHIENTEDVLGMAEAMGVPRYSALVEQARIYSENAGNTEVEKLCRLYRHLVPTKYTKLEQMKELRKLSFYPEIQASNHHISLLQSLRFIYSDLEMFDEFLAMVDEIRKYHGGRYSEHDLEYMCLTDRSSMFYRTKNYRKAMESYRLLADFALDKDGLEESSRLNNIGLCFQNMGMLDSALIFFNKSLSTYGRTLAKARESSLPIDSSFYYVVRSNIADIDVEQGRFENAEFVFLRQLRFSDQYYSPHLVLSSYLSLAKLKYQTDQLSKALAYIDSIEVSYSKLGLVNYYIRGLKLRSKIYLEKGDRGLASEAESKSEFLVDSIRAAKAELNYQAAAIQLEINETKQALLSANRGRQDAEQRSKSLGVMLLLAGLFIGVGAWGLFVVRKKNKLLSRQKNKIDAALQEREVLLREIHHRVKNNLNVVSSLIQIQGRRIKDEDVKKIFKESQNYILSMSKVHQHLYEQEDVKKIGMGLYLESLLKELVGNYWNKGVLYDVEAETVDLKLGEALVLGILSTELVTNSLKHAFHSDPGKINVNLTKDGDSCVYRYTDSGPGFESDKIDSSNSFGIKLIRLSAEQLRGQLDLQTDGEFVVVISFKTK